MRAGGVCSFAGKGEGLRTRWEGRAGRWSGAPTAEHFRTLIKREGWQVRSAGSSRPHRAERPLRAGLGLGHVSFGKAVRGF